MSVSDELGKLADLHQRGMLSDDEFTRAKARVLSGATTSGGGPASGSRTVLQRSLDDRWLGGVCGGIGRATDVPSWVWRLIFLIGVPMAGCGLLLYVLLWILIPPERLALPAPSAS